MRKHHPKNERIKRRYLTYLEEAKRNSTKTTDQVAAALVAFEQSTNHKDFAAFHIEQARRYKRMLDEQINPKTGKPLAKATIRSRLLHVKAFFQWLADQPGYKSEVSYSDSEYFNPSANDTRIATAERETRAPSGAQIRHVLKNMKADTDVEKRNRALIAFSFLTGIRDDAIASLSLRHMDVSSRSVFQDARTVRTKNRKTMTTYFFPVGSDIEAIVRDWIEFLTHERLFCPDDPVFPSTEVKRGPNGLFGATGLSRHHWSTANPVRDIFREAFEGAGLPYFNPHSFRKTLEHIGQRICRSPEEFKAWSQNLGHESVLTSFTSYGTVATDRQSEVLTKLYQPEVGNDTDAPDPQIVSIVLKYLQKNTRIT